jgi:hypothetical protein
LSDPDAVGSAINFREPQVRFSHRAPAFVALWCRGFDRIIRPQLEHFNPLDRITAAMKVLLGLVSIVIIGYLVWHWFAPTAVAPTPAQRIAPKPTTAAHPAPPPKQLAQQSAAQPTPARPATPQRRLAPEGTYFLLERASLRTDSGVVGFAPGTKVTLLEQGNSASKVTDGQYQFEVPPSQLTNDLDIAASVAQSDYAEQARITELTGKWAEEFAQQQRDALAASEKERAQKKTRPRPTPQVPK